MEENKIDKYLKQIKSKNNKSQNKYKRVCISPLRYAGGKSNAIGIILENIPKNINKVVSLFIGGGSFECVLSKHLNIEVIGYDIFDLLVNYWNVQLNNPEILYEELKKLKISKEDYNLNKERGRYA